MKIKTNKWKDINDILWILQFNDVFPFLAFLSIATALEKRNGKKKEKKNKKNYNSKKEDKKEKNQREDERNVIL